MAVVEPSTKDKKRAHQKAFSEALKKHVEIFNALAKLNQAVGKLEKGSVLGFPDEAGNVHTLTRNYIRSANAKFAHELAGMKVFLRDAYKVSKKAKQQPDSFKGVYVPSYAGPALIQFINGNKEGFGYVVPNRPESGYLIEQLRMAQMGVLLRNSITMLFYIYAHASSLQDQRDASYSTTDDHMDQSFGGQFPAVHLPTDANGRNVNVSMDDAVKQGLIPEALNTYQILVPRFSKSVDKKGRPAPFDPKRLHGYYIQNIYALNYWSRNTAALVSDLANRSAETPDQPSVVEVLDAPTSREAMLLEHNLIRSTSIAWRAELEPSRAARRAEKAAQKKAEKAAAKARGQ